MRAQIRGGPGFAALVGQDLPAEIGLVLQPVLQIAALHMVDLTQLAVLHHAAHPVGNWIEAVMKIQSAHQPPAVNGIHHFLSFLCVSCHGLFAHHMDTPLDGCHDDLHMHTVGGADVNTVRLTGVHHFLIIGESGGDTQPLGLLFCAKGVCDGDHIHIGNTAERFHMGNTDEAHANNGCF